MKKLLTVALLFSLVNIMHAQVAKLEDVRAIKKGHLIVGLSGDDQADAIFKSAINNFWTFTSATEFLPKEEALKKAKSDDNTFVLFVGYRKSKSLTHGSGISAYRTVSAGNTIEISSGKKSSVITTHIPSFEDNLLTEEVLAFGLSATQQILEITDQNNLKNSMKATQEIKKEGKDLQSKTLYIAEGWLHKKFSVEKLKAIYTYPNEVVDYETWKNVILNKEKGAAYSIISPIVVGGSYVYVHYLMDAETGKILAMVYPKTSVKVNGANVSKGNTGFVNEKIIKNYMKVANGI